MMNTIPVEVSEKVNELIQAAIRVSLAQEKVDKMEEQYDFVGERKKLETERKRLEREDTQINKKYDMFESDVFNWKRKIFEELRVKTETVYSDRQIGFSNYDLFEMETSDPLLLLCREQRGFDKFRKQYFELEQKCVEQGRLIDDWKNRKCQHNQMLKKHNKKVNAMVVKATEFAKKIQEVSRLSEGLTAVVGSIKGQLALV